MAQGNKPVGCMVETSVVTREKRVRRRLYLRRVVDRFCPLRLIQRRNHAMKRTGKLMLICGLGVWLAAPAVGTARERTDKRSSAVAAADSCARACASQARDVYKQCRDDGGTREECVRRAHHFLRQCWEDCDTPPTCDEVCEVRAGYVNDACLENGGTADECAADARLFHERCVTDFCRPANDCEARCIHEARGFVRDCVAEGNDVQACTDKGRTLLHACIDEHCADPVTCEDRCTRVAHQVLEECLQAGGDPEECTERARTAFDRCIDVNCDEPPDCEQRCARQARRIFAECVEAGGAEDVCAERARMFLRRCVEETCVEPPSCEQQCTHRAEQVFRVCVEDGHPEDECRERAKRFLDHCLDEKCREPGDCREKCAHHAHAFLHECVESGRPFDECAAAAKEGYQTCVDENCPPPPTCVDRCEHLARDAFRACVALGGTDAECEARAAEVLATCIEENCNERCGGIIGQECPDGEVCIFPPGACNVQDAIGVCKTVPDACPEIFEPVCGCDGETYDNACFAISAGVSIDHRGPCRVECDPSSAAGCGDGEFCRIPPGECDSADVVGTCTPIPSGCPDVWDPVCGCNGTTYGNACEADAAGVSIAHRGACEQRCDGIAGEPCDDGAFCLHPIGTCDVIDAQGICVEQPDHCPGIYMPVCGCDGETYGNKCEAIANGMQIAHEGPCRTVCGGIAGIPCDDGQFCQLPPGMCNAADIQGVCIDVPAACPRVWLPVCGCDGETYANECEAARAGVQIDHEGACQVKHLCRSNLDCEPELYCQFLGGGCGEGPDVVHATPGVCLPRPLGCPDIFAPVCGCDGQTYANACDAAAAGVSFRHFGECGN